MANPVWDGIVTYLTWVTTSTNSFNIPAGSGAITFILPDFTTDTTTAVEGLDPINKTTWRAVTALDVVAGSAAADAVVLPESTYVVVPATALGCGTFRLTNANTQAGLQATVIIDRI